MYQKEVNKKLRYFAYGSNMCSKRMGERGIKFSRREHAILKGWRLEFNKEASSNPEEGFANIVQDKKSVVEGILYEVQDEDLDELDKYEGRPNHYERINVKVKLDNGEEVEVETYIANPSRIKNGLKPRRKYLGYLLEGCNLLSEEYCKRLKKWETLD